MKPNDRIIYRSRRGGVRMGVFYGLTGHTHRWNGHQTALVKFDDARHHSRVEVRRLTVVEPENDAAVVTDSDVTNTNQTDEEASK